MCDVSPGVTVVVPTLNRGSYLLDTVRDLLAQTHRPLEILIVDQSDTVSSELEALAQTYCEIISHHRVDFRGLPIARNYGWQMARYELIVYVDDDVRCDGDFVNGHVMALDGYKIALSGGAVDERSEGSTEWLPRYNRWTAVPEGNFTSSASGQVDHVKGCNFAVARSALVRVGGFNEHLGVGAALHEETELCLRLVDLGSVIRFTGTARLTHLAVSSGGTRQPDYGCYVYALAHNRSILIRRHSAWYQWPVGMAWSVKLIAAYTRHTRDMLVARQGLRGLVAGWRTGGLPPACTRFEPDHN